MVTSKTLWEQEKGMCVCMCVCGWVRGLVEWATKKKSLKKNQLRSGILSISNVVDKQLT